MHLSVSIKRQKGFALISAISLSVLLLTLSLALVQLSHKTSKFSSLDMATEHAKANARLALHIAIAELQKYSGIDQSTTFRADILDTRDHPDHLPDPAIKNPFFTAASPTDPLDYPDAGKGVFLRKIKSLPAFLVSGNEHFNLLDANITAYPSGYTTHLTELDPDHSVTLHKAHNDDASTAVKAPLIPIGNRSGAYAYWVSDEGIKAKINLHDRYREQNQNLKSHASSTTEEFLSILAPSRLGNENAGDADLATDDFLAPLLDNPEALPKIVTHHTLDILGEKQKAATLQHSHDFTTASLSVLSDSQNGGLKKNLTAAVNLTDDKFLDLINHSGAESSHPSPVFLFQNFSFPSEEETLSYLHYPGAPWEVFRSFIRQPESEPALNGPTPELLSLFSNSAIPNYWELTRGSSVHLSARLVRRTPILTRFQLGLDYSLGYVGIVDGEDGEKWHEFDLRQHFLPLVSYWNPYNTKLEVTEPQRFEYYTNRDLSTGRLNTCISAQPATDAPIQIYAMPDDVQNNSVLGWLPPTTTPQEFYYPIHPNGNIHPNNKQKYYDLTNLKCEVPAFEIAPGQSVLFALNGTNKDFDKDRTIQLDRIHAPGSFTGHSAFSKYCKIRVKITPANQNDDWQNLIPELHVKRFPSKAESNVNDGTGLTRVNARNAASFQRTNWDIDKVLSKSDVRFTPVVITDNDRLPSTGPDASESPKFAAVLILKTPDTSRYFPQNSTTWQASINGIDTNPYLAPWSIFYNPLASRHGAYGAAKGAKKSFAAPPLYIAGTIIGQDAYDLVSPELSPSAEPFTGYNDSAQGGSAKSIQFLLPRFETPILSLGHFQHLNTSKWVQNYNDIHRDMASSTDSVQPVFSIGNSFASPHIPIHKTSSLIEDDNAYGHNLGENLATQYDTSFRYNNALWDRYFLTGNRPGQISSPEDLATKIPNQSLSPTPSIDLATFNDPHASATMLMLNGGFNINSTSVEAWKTILSSTIGLKCSTSTPDIADPELTPFPRLSYVDATPISSPPSDASSSTHYDGSEFRALTKQEVTQLAQELVKQVKLRGPAPTLSQFINRALLPAHLYRQPSASLPATDLVSYEGPIQSAINATDINGVFNQSNAHFPPDLAVQNESNVSDYRKGLINVKTLKYHSGYGCPATLTQADILARIGHRLTSRSDTFTIRAYGESRDSAGKVIARAWCEATVQRSPDFVNPTDSPETPPMVFQPSANPISWQPNAALSPHSQKFGRRFSITNFRWLRPDELTSL